MPTISIVAWRSHIALWMLPCLVGCAAPPLPPPMSLDSSIVGVRIETNGLFGLSKTPAETVYFVRLGADGKLPVDELIASNLLDGDTALLVNARAGDYAVVATQGSVTSTSAPAPQQAGLSFSSSVSVTSKLFTYLPESLVRHTIVHVAPGTLAFMGEFILDTSTGFDTADPLQLHYYRLIQPGDEAKSFLEKAFDGSTAYVGTLDREDRSESAQQQFIERLRARAMEAGWTPVLERSMPTTQTP